MGRDLVSAPSGVVEGLPDLPFDPDQRTYDAWYAACLRAAAEHIDDFYVSDVNDGILNFLTLRIVVARYPDRADKAREICPRVVKDAMGKLGMAAGAASIARQLDVPPEEVQRIMFHDVFEQGSDGS